MKQYLQVKHTFFNNRAERTAAQNKTGNHSSSTNQINRHMNYIVNVTIITCLRHSVVFKHSSLD